MHALVTERLLLRRFRDEDGPSGAPVWWDTYCYAVLTEEWLARPNSQKGP